MSLRWIFFAGTCHAQTLKFLPHKHKQIFAENRSCRLLKHSAVFASHSPRNFATHATLQLQSVAAYALHRTHVRGDGRGLLHRHCCQPAQRHPRLVWTRPPRSARRPNLYRRAVCALSLAQDRTGAGCAAFTGSAAAISQRRQELRL